MKKFLLLIMFFFICLQSPSNAYSRDWQKKDWATILNEGAKRLLLEKSDNPKDWEIAADQYFNCREFVKAMELYKKSAAYGNTSASYKVANMYLTGRGVKQSDDDFLIWLSKSGKHIPKDAYIYIARGYYNGHPFQQNDEQAFKWAIKAAEVNDADGYILAGGMLLEGRGISKDEEEAYYWFRKAKDAHHPKAEYMIGYYYSESSNPKKALEWWTIAAEKGFKPAQKIVAQCYKEGFGTTTNKEAAKYWQKKAQSKQNN